MAPHAWRLRNEAPVSPRFGLLLAAVFFLGAGLFLLFRQPAQMQLPAAVAAPEQQVATPAEAATVETAPVAVDGGDTPAAPGKDRFLILAASWEPAFCEGAPDKLECTSMGNKRFDASHFSLHGLWPQESYCGVSQTLRDLDEKGRWSQLPPVELDAATRATLDQVMPGTRSQLERHEWIKHGTCSGLSQSAYFGVSILLLSALNGSPVRDLFADSIGRKLTAGQIRNAFDTSFGAGAGDRVKIACDADGQRMLISEITLGLWGQPEQSTNLSQLLLAARPTSPGCDGGIVDASGLQ